MTASQIAPSNVGDCRCVMDDTGLTGEPKLVTYAAACQRGYEGSVTSSCTNAGGVNHEVLIVGAGLYQESVVATAKRF